MSGHGGRRHQLHGGARRRPTALAPVLGSLRVEPDGSHLVPVSGLARPACRVSGACGLIEFVPGVQHGTVFSAMLGVRGDEADGAMPVLGVVLADEDMNPGARFFDGCEATRGPGRDVLAGPEDHQN